MNGTYAHVILVTLDRRGPMSAPQLASVTAGHRRTQWAASVCAARLRELEQDGRVRRAGTAPRRAGPGRRAVTWEITSWTSPRAGNYPL